MAGELDKEGNTWLLKGFEATLGHSRLAGMLSAEMRAKAPPLVKGDLSSSLLDVSLQGIKIEVPEEWPGHIGESFTVRLFCEDGRVISMETRASHIDGRAIGFFCKGLDMSSMFLLRDIIEQAFSDQEQFLKELKEWW